MKIFISYGNDNLEFVDSFAKNLQAFGEIRYWDKSKELGKDSWNTIFSWIDNSDLVIAIITDSVIQRAMAVGQEVGRAISKGKMIIPLVTNDVPTSSLGCLNGVTHQRFDLSNPDEAIAFIHNAIKNKKTEIDNNNFILLMGTAIALITVLSKK